MVPATVHCTRCPARWLLGGIALVCLLGEPGCTRLQSFRKPEQPAFGTELVSRAEGGDGRALSGDLYAQRVGRVRGRKDGKTAIRDENRSPEHLAAEFDRGPRPSPGARTDADRAAGPAEGPEVALLTPEPLAPFREREGKPSLVARRVEAAPAQEPAGTGSTLAPAPGPSLAALIGASRKKLDGVSYYRVKMSHQERIGGTLKPSEDAMLSIRRNPKAVRLEWLEGQNQGREVIFADAPDGGMMHVHMPNSIMPRIKMRPDSPLVARNSRHPISEAGFDTIIEAMETALRAQQAHDPSYGVIRYAGMETPEGLAKACHKVSRVTTTSETWNVYLDPETQLPTVVRATAANGDLLENYVFRDPALNPPELARADAFDPDARWGPSQGLLQRMARSGSSQPKDTETR